MTTKDINIVLFGETGVGKSTFINAFFNYLVFDKLQDAIKSKDINCLIPCRFVLTDDNLVEQVIQFGQDPNECTDPGASSTQEPRSYRFSFNDINIRLIDTPGIGDTRGITKDEENFDKVLIALGELEYVHAFCILLKPNSCKLTILFEYCIKQLLSKLDKSASENIVFVMTNSRSTFSKLGETSSTIKVLLNQLKEKPPFVTIPFCKENVFCMDNEAFRFLLAKRQNIAFSEIEENEFATSWEKSAKVCAGLIDYIGQLSPHTTQNTVSVNEARRLILNISQPLVEIVKNIDDNLRIIKAKQEELNDENKSTEELKKLLYYEIIKLNVEELDNPKTVCTDNNCTDTYEIKGSRSIDYKQVCHPICYLKDVPKKVVGAPELKHCAAMDGNKINPICKECQHSYELHMHIYYTTKPYTSREIDEKVHVDIKEKKQLIIKIKEVIDETTKVKEEMEEEKKIIQNAVAKFAHFLRNNALSAYNDKYHDYILYLLRNEQMSFSGKENMDLIKSYKDMLKTHTKEQRILDDELNKAKEKDSNASVISAKDVIYIINELYALNRYGSLIKKYYDCQQLHKRDETLFSKEKKVSTNFISRFYEGVKSTFKNLIGLKAKTKRK